MELIKKNLLSLAIVILLVIVILQKCGESKPVDLPTVTHDTTWIVKDSLIYSKPKVVNSVSIVSNDTIIHHYLPDTNYSRLVLQYQAVVNELLAKNIHEDSVKIDTIGYAIIRDTVQKNLITGRSTQVNVKYPVILEKVVIPAKKVNQLYIGGAFQTSFVNQQVGVGALLKTRNDFIFGGSLSVNTYGDQMYGLGAYWKLKLKK